MCRDAEISDKSSDAGFSLFECIVALAIFSMAVLSGISLITQNTQSASRLEAQVFAGFVAENVLVETRLLDRLDLGVSEGEAEMSGIDFDWSREVLETGEGNLRSVVVRVREKDADQVLAMRYGFQNGAP
ncbi:MAG: type II secretion system protein GspI [Ponticaulis sp.]|nr:type II secretion system protein GspI [Ponticaulis sp.]|tara:strand:- start:6335 stop:6724 length:390 start_codon:yes stop_codon:yes gene_type:complete